MNETLVQEGQSAERIKKLVLFLIIVNTVIGAMVAFLQTDAGIRANQANADSQYYSILASGDLVKSSIQGNYDMATYTEVLRNTQESLVYQFTSLDPNSTTDPKISDSLTLQATILAAKADKARYFSVLFTDPRYAPKAQDQLPDFQAYLSDQTSPAKELVEKQNSAADAYQVWNNKSDTYVAVITILAVAFFLLGFSQSTESRIRVFMAVLGALIMLIGTFWGLVTLFS